MNSLNIFTAYYMYIFLRSGFIFHRIILTITPGTLIFETHTCSVPKQNISHSYLNRLHFIFDFIVLLMQTCFWLLLHGRPLINFRRTHFSLLPLFLWEILLSFAFSNQIFKLSMEILFVLNRFRLNAKTGRQKFMCNSLLTSINMKGCYV